MGVAITAVGLAAIIGYALILAANAEEKEHALRIHEDENELREQLEFEQWMKLR